MFGKKENKNLDGKLVYTQLIDGIKVSVQELVSKYERIPTLHIILVGEDYGSVQYVNMKKKKGQEVGIDVHVNTFDEGCSEEEIVSLIKKLNEDSSVDGVMVQLPLPKNLDTNKVLETIDPEKDVDGLTSSNLGKLFKGSPDAIPSATPLGIVKLLDHYNIDLVGKDVVVIGRSDIVGLPLSAMLINRDSTVTVCHSKTENLKEICKKADIVVVGIGKPEYIDKSYIKKGCVIIDVGTNKNIKDELVGDVKYKDVINTCSYITPVPGGVGPMTIACLLNNLIDAYRRNEESKK